MDTKNIRISDYAYHLPDERIAKFPLAERDQSKLLVYRHGAVSQDHFFNLPQYLPKGALMIFNNTKVIQARLHFLKDTGAQIEIFLLEPAQPTDYEQIFLSRNTCSWYCLVGNSKKWKEGPLHKDITIDGRSFRLTASRGETKHAGYRIDFEWDDASATFAEILESIGELPIPPYLNRQTVEADKHTYQTVYSKVKGSVAAPTAGLHFTPDVLSAIAANGITLDELTLHVGAGTFKPVKSIEIADHDMHTEYISVRRDTLLQLLNHLDCVIAVGTTSVRTLESIYYMGCKLAQNPHLSEAELHVTQWQPYSTETIIPLSAAEAIQHVIDYLDRNHLAALHSSTQIIIAPGYEYKIVKILITNFHQPQSTLLLLVSAFVRGDWRTIYDYALANDFRFLSYGDSSVLIN